MRSMRIMLTGLAVATWMAVAGVDAKDISALPQTGSAFTEIARQALPAVVFVDVESTQEVPGYRYYQNPLDELFGREYYYRVPDTRKYHQEGQGSGFLISKDGYIMTNNHVVKDADRITVTTADGRKFGAKLIGTDPKTEVALIKIDDDKDFPFLALGDSDALQVGEWVLAAGNPFGLQQTITAGIVSAKERSEVGITEYANFIQTDAAINPGNSGGPLLNIHGEVIGINTAIYSQTGGYMGIGFAIPINQAVQVKEQLIAHGKVQRSMLGIFIQEVTEDLAESFGLQDEGGILISQVKDGSASDKAGLKQGDIIVELDDVKVRKVGAFRNRVAMTPPDTEVTLKIFREGKYMTIQAVTDPMDDEGSVASADDEPASHDKLGLRVQNLDSDMAERMGYNGGGILISEVSQDGAARRAGLRPGQIILKVGRKSVDSTEQFRQALDALGDAGQVRLLITDGRGIRFVLVPLD